MKYGYVRSDGYLQFYTTNGEPQDLPGLTRVELTDDIPPGPAGHSYHWGAQQWQDNRPPEYFAAKARQDRDQLLVDSDWTDTLSAKTRLGDTLYQEWQTYRQALRDVPQQAGFPTNITWPTAPSST
jgi:hypothetical protein